MIEEEVIIYVPEIYNKFYIHYDHTGTILSISNVKDESLTSIEVEFDEVEDFLSGKKQHSKYKIAFFENLEKPVIHATEQVVKSNELLYIIPKTASFNNEVTLVHDKSAKKWTLALKDKIPNREFTFYITMLNNPHFLYKTLYITDQLNFTEDIEFDLSKISILTAKEFNSYGIKENL